MRRLGKSEEIGPPLKICADEGFSARRVTDEEGKVERLCDRFKRTTQRPFDYQAQLTRYRQFESDQFTAAAVDILRCEHDPSDGGWGSRANAQHARLDCAVKRGLVMPFRCRQQSQRIHLGARESRACELSRRSSCLEDSVSSTGDYRSALIDDDGANGNRSRAERLPRKFERLTPRPAEVSPMPRWLPQRDLTAPDLDLGQRSGMSFEGRVRSLM